MSKWKRKNKFFMAIAVAAVIITGISAYVSAVYYDGYFTNVLAKGSITDQGTLAVTGAATLSSTLAVTGAITATGGVTDVTGGVTAGEIADVVRYIPLPIMAFTHNGSAVITSSTAPGLESDDYISNIVWADGETTPVQISFRVPGDYASGGAFKILATESNSTTPNQVDFDVYVNADGSAADSSATDQTPVALAGTTSTPDEITLTVATDFASLAAGNWVTLRIWRDDTATGSGDLEVKGAVYYYTATQ